MIPTPQFSQLSLDAFMAGSIGYTLGCLGAVDEKLVAGIFIIASLANQILFHLTNACFRPDFSAEAVYIGTNTLVTTAMIVAARYFEFISRRSVGMLTFVSVAILTARLKIVADREHLVKT